MPLFIARGRIDDKPVAVPSRNGLVHRPPWYEAATGSMGSRAVRSGLVVTTSVDRLEARLGGQAQKRGLIPRMPAGDRLLADAVVWLNGEYADADRSARTRTLAGGETEVAIDLHPAATPVVITADDTGRVTVLGDTALAGPGYHRFVGRVLERLGIEIGIERNEGDGALAFADRPVAERAYLGWLGPQLARAKVIVGRGGRGAHIGMPVGTVVTTDAAIATVLGPRDEAWLEAAIADPRVALDITPWWTDATDGKYLLNRALVLMWLDVRWRAPAIEGEADLADEVHRLLSRAFPMDPGLPYPYHAWAELCAFRGINDAMARQVAGRAATTLESGTPIGYRRDPVRITHEGWTLEIPGAYAERRSPEEFWAGGAGRAITLAATPTGLPDGSPMPAAAFLDQFAAELGADALRVAEGEVVGRARLATDATSGVEVGILEGYSAIKGSGAAVKLEFDDPGDWQWAVDVWRSLRPG
jgi:hypothetical protein